MFFIIFGEDNYRSKQKLSQIIQQYKEKNKTNLSLFFFDYENTVDFSDVELATKQISMFSEKKLIIISKLFTSKKIEDQNKILNLLKKIQCKDIFFIFYDLKILVANKLFKFLKQKKSTQIQEFKPLKGIEINNWIIKEFSKNQIKIQKQALNLFIDYIENDTWRIQNEVNKLSNYCQTKREIEVEDIKLLVHPKKEINIFQTIESIANKNESRALKLIYNHIKKGDSELYILSMIAYQFKNLLIIKDLLDKGKKYEEIGKELILHPFILRKNFKQATIFKMKNLKNIYNKILEIDLKIKKGLNPQFGIELLIYDNKF